MLKPLGVGTCGDAKNVEDGEDVEDAKIAEGAEGSKGSKAAKSPGLQDSAFRDARLIPAHTRSVGSADFDRSRADLRG